MKCTFANTKCSEQHISNMVINYPQLTFKYIYADVNPL